MDISSYIASKREKGVYTEPAFDSLVQQQPEQPDPVATAQIPSTSTKAPSKNVSSVETALLIPKARASGLNDKQA